MHIKTIFFLALLGFLATQTYIWCTVEIIDSTFWTKRVVYLSQDLQHGPIHFDPLRHPSHPAMPGLMAASLLHRVGLDPEISLRIITMCMDSVILAALLTILYTKPYPKTWVVYVSAFLLFNRLFLSSNSFDAISCCLILFSFILALEHVRTRASLQTSFLLSLCIGMAAATRIHTSLPLLIPIFALLCMYTGVRRTFIVFTAAIAFFFACNPFLWHTPGTFFQDTLFHETVYVVERSATLPDLIHIPLSELIQTSPITVIGVVLAFILLYTKKNTPFGSPWFLSLLLISTTLLFSILRISHVESIRYYYPIMMIWEVFTPLLILPIIKKVQEKYTPHLPLVPIFFILLIAGQILISFSDIS